MKRTYVLTDHKVLFVSLAKNACTSIKWLLADLAGEDPEQFRPRLRNFMSGAEAIHDRPAWQHVQAWSDLTRDERDKISPDNGWFVFGVTRDPRARVFSAWQNKFLMRGTGHQRHREEPWYPSRDFSAEGIRRDFEAFVDSMLAEPGHPVMADPHFRSQTSLLRRKVIPFSRVYDITNLGAHDCRPGCAPTQSRI